MAVGRIGLSLGDFALLTPEEFGKVCEEWRQGEEERRREEWERMRLLATITIQPHVKGRMRPEKLLPFPWEKPKTVRGKAMSAADRGKLIRRLEGKK